MEKLLNWLVTVQAQVLWGSDMYWDRVPCVRNVLGKMLVRENLEGTGGSWQGHQSMTQANSQEFSSCWGILKPKLAITVAPCLPGMVSLLHSVTGPSSFLTEPHFVLVSIPYLAPGMCQLEYVDLCIPLVMVMGWAPVQWKWRERQFHSWIASLGIKSTFWGWQTLGENLVLGWCHQASKLTKLGACLLSGIFIR